MNMKLSSLQSIRLLLSLFLIAVAAVHPAAAEPAKPTTSGPAKNTTTSTPASKNETDSKSNQDEADKIPSVKSQIIQQAPEVELLNNGDIDPEGACKKDVATFCANVRPGSSHLAECLQNRIEDEEDGNVELSGKVLKKCKEAVTDYKIKLATNINYDTAMARDCKVDAEKLCGDLDDVKFSGKIIACLREAKPALSSRCREHITRAQLEAAKDYRIDAYVYDSCKMDAYKLCPDVEAGSGRVNACLRDKRDEVWLLSYCSSSACSWK